jgi:hypothetical protein
LGSEEGELGFRRVVIAAALLTLTTALAIVAGWPDIGRSLDLVTGAGITGATGLAAIGLLCWLALAAMISVVAAGALRHLKRRTAVARWLWSVAVLVVGISLLAAGIVRHQSGYRVCCASSLTVQQAEHRVH